MRKSGFSLAVTAVLLTAACGSSGNGPSSLPSTGSSPITSPSPTALTPNGVGKKAPKAMLAAAMKALSGSSSVRFKANVVDQKQRITMDLQVTRTGTKGTVSMPFKGKRGTMQLIVLGKESYVQGTGQFWQNAIGAEKGPAAGKLAGQMFGGHWVKMPTSSGMAQGMPASPADVAKMFTSTTGPLKKGKPKTVDGRPAIGLISSDGTMYIATTGDPVPLLVAPAKAAQKQQATFSDYDVPVPITAPAGALDLTKLK